ncbi:MAG: biotin-dependent carboxyltransferase family protein [Allorhizobium sp.]
MIEILTTGAVNSVQDLGRFGYLDAGVGCSGAMDAEALLLANLLIGNAPGLAGLELTLFPFRLKFCKTTIFAFTGADCPATLSGRAIRSWWAMAAQAGDVLEIGLPRSGARAYLAFAGGIAVPEVLGSRATDLKSGWGGFEGRGLKRGDVLAVGEAPATANSPAAGFGLDPLEVRMLPPAAGSAMPIRVLPSAEFAAFSDTMRADFFAADWKVSAEANRQGYRLEGPDLHTTQRLELFSHGIMPGTVQVPPSGQPIIQLAEANTCGGYPKIANVIEADLWRLAQTPSGATLRFIEVDLPAAIAALRLQRSVAERVAAFCALVRKDKVAPGTFHGLRTPALASA